MADIQITLDAAPAIKQADALDSAFINIESNVQAVQRAFNNLKIKLDATNVAEKFKGIKKFVTDASFKDPIWLYTTLVKPSALKGDYKKIKVIVQKLSRSDPIMLATKLKEPKKKKPRQTVEKRKHDIPFHLPGERQQIAHYPGTDITKALESRSVAQKKYDNQIAKSYTEQKQAENEIAEAREKALLKSMGARKRSAYEITRDYTKQKQAEIAVGEAREKAAVKSMGVRKKFQREITNDYTKQKQAEIKIAEARDKAAIKRVSPVDKAKEQVTKDYTKQRQRDIKIGESRDKAAIQAIKNEEKAIIKKGKTRHSQYVKAKQEILNLHKLQSKELGKGYITKAGKPLDTKKSLRKNIEDSVFDPEIAEHFYGAPAKVNEQRRFVEKQREKIYGKKFEGTKMQTGEVEDSLNKVDELQEKIARKTPKTISEVKGQYEELSTRVKLFREQVASGTISQEKFNRKIMQTDNEFKELAKSTKKVGKAGGILSTTFGKITMTLTAIAASLFILQELRQYITALVSVGTDYVKTLARIQGETGKTKEGTDAFASVMKSMAAGTVFTLKDMYEAFKELRKQGLGASEAMQKTVMTLRMSRSETLDVAKAAEIAANDVHGLTEEMLRTDTALSATASDAWGKLGKAVKGAIAEFYIRKEPMFIRWIEGFTKFVTDTLPRVLDAASALLNIFDKALWPVKRMFEILGKMASLMEGMSFEGFFKDPKKDPAKELKAINEELRFQLGLIEKTKSARIAERQIAAEAELPAESKYEFKQGEKLTEEKTQKIFGVEYKIAPTYKKVKTEIKETKVAEKDLLKFTEDAIKRQVKGWEKLIPVVARYKVLLEELKIDVGFDPEQMGKLHESLFKTLGTMSDAYYKTQMAKIDEEARLFDDAVKYKIARGEDEEAAFLAAQAAKIYQAKKFNLEQLKIKKPLDDQYKLFKIIGTTSKEYYDYSTTYHDNIIKKLDQEVRLMQGVSDQGKRLYVQVKTYLEKQKDLKPIMDDYAKVFKLTGIMADAYYRKLIKDIQFEVRLMKIRNKEINESLIMQIKLNELREKYVSEKVGRHEAVLEETGIMTPFLMGQRRLKDWLDFEEKAKKHPESRAAYAKQLQKKGIELDIEEYAKRLELGEEHFNKLGIASDKYRKLASTHIENLRAIAHGTYPEMGSMIDEIYNKMQKDLKIELGEPELDRWKIFYDQTGIMSAKHYEMEKERVDDTYQTLLKSLDDAGAAYTWYYKSIEQLQVQQLEGTDRVGAGFLAAIKQQGLSQKTLAKDVSEFWGKTFDDFESKFATWVETGKSSFSDLINSMLKDLSRLATSRIFNQLWGQLAGDIGKAFSGSTTGRVDHYDPTRTRHAGGHVGKGESYLIGTQGPERLTMGNRPGYVTPNHMLGSGGGGPGVKVIVNNNTGVESEVRQEGPEFDGQEWVVNVFLDAYERNKGGLRERLG